MPKSRAQKRKEAADRLDAYATRIETVKHWSDRQKDMFSGATPEEIAKAVSQRRLRAANLRAIGRE